MAAAAPASIAARRGRGRWYFAVCLFLLIIAAALRFWDLPEHILWYDEATVANHARESISELVRLTRYYDTSPILNPAILYTIQQIESSPLTVRLASAAAGTLTVGAMLFLLPRAGLSRRIALPAALLYILSVPAIEHGQSALVYTVDALVATLLIAGLLQYVHNGKKMLLGMSLFMAPLTQYGLVLLSIAVIGAALAHSPCYGGRVWDYGKGRVGRWVGRRIGLVGPMAFFIAGCIVTYAVTLRFQLADRGRVVGYLEPFYYQGELNDLVSMLEFVYSRIGWFLRYHLPWDDAGLLAAAVTALILLAFLAKGRFNLVITLFLFSIIIAIAAALLKIYPLGDIRQAMYLAPALFLAVSCAIHSLAERAASRLRRRWLAPAGTALFVGAIAFYGIQTINQDTPYQEERKDKDILAYLKEIPREGEAVYVSARMSPTVRFYQWQRDDDYHYCPDNDDFGYCRDDLLHQTNFSPSGKTWVVAYRYEWEKLGGFDGRFRVEDVADGRNVGGRQLVLRLIRGRAVAPAQWLGQIDAAGEPLIRGDFDVYAAGSELLYIKDPCHPSDVEARFALHLFPANLDDLPADRRGHGFDNLDFVFREAGGRHRGAIVGRRCLAAVRLPDYPVVAVRTGQFVRGGDGGVETLWSGRGALGQ